MEALAAYIPMDRRQALARGEILPSRTIGSVLFADISGFTRLTAALAQELGPQRGAEELTHQLNRVYGALIDEVHRYHGSVIGFSGDAITCWFDGNSATDSAQTSRHATTCALVLQHVMTKFATLFTSLDQPFPLGIKVAVASGSARRFLVGHPRIQRIETLAGVIVDRMAAAEQQLQQGEVIVGAEVMAWFGNQAQLKEWRTDSKGEHFAVITRLDNPVPPAPWPETPDLSADIAQNWLLPPVYHRLRQGEGEFLAELRSAVALLLQFTGIDYDQDDESGAKLDAYIRWVQTVLARYEGYLIQLTVGDKGNYLYAVFGAPLAHEDDPARAVAAALELQSLPENLSFISNVQIGISQGQMRVGAYGGPAHRTYGVLGNAVNIAARLMDRAEPGQILVTTQITKATEYDYDWHEHTPVLLKGLPEPLSIFVLRGRRQAQAATVLKRRAPTSIVGRMVEQALLAEGLQALLDGQNGSIIIEGEAGIGKSRLVVDLVEQAQSLGIPVLVGAGDAIEQTTAYQAWRPIFRKLFGVYEIEDTVTVRHHVMEQLENEPDLLERTPLLNAVLPLNLPDTTLTAQMVGEVRATNTRDFLLQILERTQRAVAVFLLVLEDGHWLDSASWALAHAASQQIESLLLVVATRPITDPVPAEYSQLLKTPNTQHMRLEMLPRKATEALVCQYLGVTELPSAVAELIANKAEGHPFFSEELASALRDAGLIQVTDGVCHIAPDTVNLGALDFPNTIQGVITNRIDRLPPQQQLMTKVASVVGRIFAFRILHDIYPVESDKQQLPGYLEAVERLDLARLETPEPDLAYIFKHVITQEVAYSLLLFDQRQKLHQAIAEWYEQTHTDDLAPFYPILAHHWGKAEVVPKTIDYLEKAGEQALRNYANREAVAFFSEAIALVDKSETTGSQENVKYRVTGEHYVSPPQLRKARWERQLAEAYFGLGEIPKCQEHFRRALRLLNKPEPTSTAGLAISSIWEFLVQILHSRWPERFSGRSKEPLEVIVEAARAYSIITDTYYFTGPVIGAMYGVLRSLNLAESARSHSKLSEVLTRGYAGLGGVYAGVLRMVSLADPYFHKARVSAERDSNIPALNYALFATGMLKSVNGAWEESEENLRKSMELNERLGDSRNWETAVATIEYVKYNRGLFAKCRQLAKDRYASAYHREDIQFQVSALCWQALALLALGQTLQALPLLEQAADLLPESGYPAEAVLTNGLVALAYLRQGNDQLALQFTEAAANVENAPASIPAVEGHSAVAVVSMSLWEASNNHTSEELKRLANLTQQAIATLRTTARQFSYIHKPRVGLYQGRHDWLAGKPSKAHKAWRKSLMGAKKLKMPYDQARLHYEIGRHLDTNDPARQDHLMQALEIFERLGAAYDLTKAHDAFI